MRHSSTSATDCCTTDLFIEQFIKFTTSLGNIIHSCERSFTVVRSPVALAAAYAHPIEFIIGKTHPLVDGAPLIVVTRRYYPVNATAYITSIPFVAILDLDYFWQHFNTDPSFWLPISVDLRACHRTAWLPRFPSWKLRRKLRCAWLLRLVL